MMKPKNTFESVMRQLVEGLETGTIQLNDEFSRAEGPAAGMPPAGLRTLEPDRQAAADRTQTEGGIK
jgi:hypothetical protein